MIEPLASPTNATLDRRMHPALRRRILAVSPNPEMQLQACWDAIADQTELLETILQNIAACESASETIGRAPCQSPARQQALLLAASGLRLTQSLIQDHTVNDDREHLSKSALRLLSGISILLSALSETATDR